MKSIPAGILFFSVSFTGPAFATAPAPARDDSSCAKTSLAAIYSAEKSYYAEFDTFADSDRDIGFAPEKKECPSWEHSIRISANGQEFWAEAHNRKTAEHWKIDKTKTMTQETVGR